jgi:hypothetical protein
MLWWSLDSGAFLAERESLNQRPNVVPHHRFDEPERLGSRRAT